jgi:hypothetical protein
MNRVRIRLETFSDVQNFVKAVATSDSEVYLTDGNRFCVSGKSLLGAMCSIEWNEIYCESTKPIDFLLMEYIIGE